MVDSMMKFSIELKAIGMLKMEFEARNGVCELYENVLLA